LTRRVSKPLRALKVFSPKSKSKGQDAGSQTSASETASVSSSAPLAEPTITKVVVVQAQIVDEVQRPAQVAKEKQRDEHEAERRSSHDQLDSTPPSHSEPQNVASEPQPTPEIASATSESIPQPPSAPDVDTTKSADVSNEEDTTSPRSPEPSTDDAVPSTTEEAAVAADIGSEEQALVADESIPSTVDVAEKDVQVVVAVEEQSTAGPSASSHETQPLAESEFVVVLVNDDDPPPPVTVVELFDEKSKDMDMPSVEEQLPSSSVAAVAPLDDPVADINPFIEDVSLSASSENVTSSEDKPPSEPSPLSSPDVSPELSSSAPAHPLSELPNTPLNVNKDVPPSPPAASDSESDEAAPVIHAPGLTLPTLFLPIPNVRLLDSILHLTWWLTAKVTSFSFWRVSRPTR